VSAALYNRLARVLPLAPSQSVRARLVAAIQGKDSIGQLPAADRKLILSWEAALDGKAAADRSSGRTRHDHDELLIGGIIAAKYNLAEPRDPDGKWSKIGAAVGAVKDAMKIAGRIELGDGETFEGSSRLSLPNADVRMALTREAGGSPSLRFGIGSELPDKWRGANGGYTVKLDRQGIDDLAAATSELAKATKQAERDADRMYAHIEDVAERVGEDVNAPRALGYKFRDPQLNALVEQYDTFTDESTLREGAVDSPWGQLYYRAVMTDTGASTYLLVTKPGAKLTGNDALAEMRGYSDPAEFDPADMRKLASALAKIRAAAASSAN
jgi:hypothetical protein